VDPLSILDVVGRRDVHQVTELDSTISSGDYDKLSSQSWRRLLTLVERNFALLNIVLTQTNENSILSSLPSDYTSAPDRCVGLEVGSR
jgi:hypothetical protein